MYSDSMASTFKDGYTRSGQRTFWGMRVTGALTANSQEVTGPLAAENVAATTLTVNGDAALANLTSTGATAAATTTIGGTTAFGGDVVVTGATGCTDATATGAGSFQSVTTGNAAITELRGSAGDVDLSPTATFATPGVLDLFADTATTGRRRVAFAGSGGTTTGYINSHTNDTGTPIADHGMAVTGAAGDGLWLRTTDEDATSYVRLTGPAATTSGGALWNQLPVINNRSVMQRTQAIPIPISGTVTMSHIMSGVLQVTVASGGGTIYMPSAADIWAASPASILPSPPAHILTFYLWCTATTTPGGTIVADWGTGVSPSTQGFTVGAAMRRIIIYIESATSAVIYKADQA